MPTLRQDKLGNYFIDYRINGKRFRPAFGKNKKLAMLKHKEYDALVSNSKHGYTPDQDITMDQLLVQNDRWYTTNISKGTKERYDAMINNFKAFVSNEYARVRLVQQMRPKIFEDYKSYRKEQGIAISTINNELSVFKAIFTRAIDWGYLRHNPLDLVKKIRLPKPIPPRFLRQSECDRLMRKSSAWFKPILIAFLNTGMRKAELENLTWDDVDLNQNIILIRVKDGWQPKTNERTIPINDKMRKVFMRLRGQQSNRLHVFTNKSGGKLSRNHIRTKLLATAQAAGIDDLTKVHTLRHTFASHLAMAGVDMPTLKNIMGHSDISTTMIYSHTTDKHLDDAVNRISL